MLAAGFTLQHVDAKHVGFSETRLDSSHLLRSPLEGEAPPVVRRGFDFAHHKLRPGQPGGNQALDFDVSGMHIDAYENDADS